MTTTAHTNLTPEQLDEASHRDDRNLPRYTQDSPNSLPPDTSVIGSQMAEKTPNSQAGGVVEPIQEIAHGGRFWSLILSKIRAILNVFGGSEKIKFGAQLVTFSSGCFALGTAFALMADNIPHLDQFEFIQSSSAIQAVSQAWNSVTIHLLWTALGAIFWCLAIKNGPIDRFIQWAQRTNSSVMEHQIGAGEKEAPKEPKWILSLRERFRIKDVKKRKRNEKWSQRLWTAWLVISAGAGLWSGVALTGIKTAIAFQSSDMAELVKVTSASNSIAELMTGPADANTFSRHERACEVANVRAGDARHSGGAGGYTSAITHLVLASNERILYGQGCEGLTGLALHLKEIQTQIIQNPSLIVQKWPIFPGMRGMYQIIQAKALQATVLKKDEIRILQSVRLTNEVRITQGGPDWVLSKEGLSETAKNHNWSDQAPTTKELAANSTFLNLLIAHPESQKESAEELTQFLVHDPVKPDQAASDKIMDTAKPVTADEVRQAMLKLKAEEPNNGKN